MHIDTQKSAINGTVNVIGFIDKHTRQHVIYIPAFDISGYGKTEKKALEMLKVELDGLSDSFVQISV